MGVEVAGVSFEEWGGGVECQRYGKRRKGLDTRLEGRVVPKRVAGIRL